MNRDISSVLERAIEWADERLRSGTEPPWSYYRLMQLKEAATQLLPNSSGTATEVNLPGLSGIHEYTRPDPTVVRLVPRDT